MCDTNLYVIRKGREELFMENIDVIRREGDTFLLRDIFGEEKSLKGRFVETSLLKHRVVLEEI